MHFIVQPCKNEHAWKMEVQPCNNAKLDRYFELVFIGVITAKNVPFSDVQKILLLCAWLASLFLQNGLLLYLLKYLPTQYQTVSRLLGACT